MLKKQLLQSKTKIDSGHERVILVYTTGDQNRFRFGGFIMLAQFQSLYPNGSIISELVQIFQGKYIVRVSVQIEGITRATAMAAAETVEVAEDLARDRALVVLGIQQEDAPKIDPNDLQETTDVIDSQWLADRHLKVSPHPSIELEDDIHSKSTSIGYNKNNNQFLSQDFSVPILKEQPTDTLVASTDNFSSKQVENPLLNPPLLENPISNVTPFIPRSYHHQEETQLAGTKEGKKHQEPINLSDVIAKTDVEMQRLGWTQEQGRDYLKKTYSKQSRRFLSEVELLDFLRYLETQPDQLPGF